MPPLTGSTHPNSGIRDNQDRGSVGSYLQQHMHHGSHLSVVSAYFTIYAYQALQGKLDTIGSLRFLFGEPRFVSALDPERSETKAFLIRDDGIALANSLAQKPLAKACADWIRAKVEIRSITQTNLLHGKMYHIDNGGVERAILGSSNFTSRGLGLAGDSQNNVELNLVVDSDRDKADLKAWFDQLWADEKRTKDVHADVLRYLGQLYENHAPEFIYYKTLFHLFEQYLADQSRTDRLTEQHLLANTSVWQSLFAFQKDGVKAAINKILTYNGCILADSVGLGKTYEALAAIKYFELRNERVLVLCPKKLRENWTVFRLNDARNPFVNDRFRYDVLSHTDLSRDGGMTGDIDLSMINWGNYDLVVIDESHNFRNYVKGQRDQYDQRITPSRYERLMENIIRAGVRSKVLLLSATPVNNGLRDLYNQISLITAGQDTAFAESLSISNISSTLTSAQKVFTEWAEEKPRDARTLLDRLDGDVFKLLDALTIARSRKHIQRYYSETIDQLGGFPERNKPLSRAPVIDTRNRFMSYEKLNEEISRYKLSLYSPFAYVLPEHRTLYERDRVANFSQANRERYLVAMMKINLLKRLESSVSSFALTLERTITKIELLEARIAHFKQLRDEHPEVTADEAIVDPDDEELQAALEVGRGLSYKLAHLDVDAWHKDLTNDKQQLDVIYSSAVQITVERDAKLAELKLLIAAKATQPSTNKRGEANRKVLVFTAFADTARYLYTALQPWARAELGIHCALVTGTGQNGATLGSSDFASILTNFSPRSKQRAWIPQMPQDGEIDLLIATDCISEGQNLQDCDYLINYDIHWNPVRIIQRFGRIDRIGSVNTRVQLVNFWPTEDLNRYLSLRERVESRMALVDLTATGGDDLLESHQAAANDLNYRDQQLLRLRDEIPDLEDFNESVALTEFTLDDFRLELMQFIATNRQTLEDAPPGLYAVVPPAPEHGVEPGVIFCLCQRNQSANTERVNPLQPYFLIYIYDNGDVRYGFAQPKQILEVYRLLCAGTTVQRALCDLFDDRTADGSNMAHYTTLLHAAADAIIGSFRRRMASQHTRSRSAMLLDVSEQIDGLSDFELVTWLVVLDAA